MLCKYRGMPDSETYQPRVPRATRDISVRGIEYCLYEWGNPDSPLLIYLHGWADTGSTFQFVVDRLSADWHVVAPDWRGFGRSSCDCTSYWFPDYLADLHAFLDIYSRDRPARLIGHSMGANIASLYAGSLPERVQAFVNIEGFGLPDSNPDDAPGRYRRWIESALTGTSFSEYRNLEALAERIEKRHPRMKRSEASFIAREWAVEGADGVARLRADPRHKLPNPVLYRRAEAEACWRAVTARTLLVVGGNSAFEHEFGQRAALTYASAESITIEDAGHMLHFEAPGALARAIEKFMLTTL